MSENQAYKTTFAYQKELNIQQLSIYKYQCFENHHIKQSIVRIHIGNIAKLRLSLSLYIMKTLLVVMIICVVVNQVTGENSVPALTQVAINNLTSAVLELLAKSALNCPTSGRDSRDSIADLVQLVLTQQLLSQSPDNKRKCNNKEIIDLVSTLSTQIAKLSSRIDHLDKAVRNITGLLEDEDECAAIPLVYSCEEIKTNWPDNPSDYYTIADSNGHVRHVYCHMEELCGSDEGWMRVAYLNMSDPNEKCPEEFRLYEENGVRACGRPSTSSGSCVSTTYPSKDISYSQVCGKVIGYQFGSPDGSNNDGIYIDGISITHGNPRSHIWSFICGTHESHASSNCPCGTVGPKTAPSFVGDDYFCESGAPSPWQAKLYTGDPLWDGKGCGSIEKPCCSLPGLPWFHKTLGYTTTDYIEMRLCCSSGTGDEDVPFSIVELYKK